MVRTGKIQRCELWTEKISRVCGMERLMRRIAKKEGIGIYGVILLGIFLQFGIAQLIVYFLYGWTQWSVWIKNPIDPLLVSIGFLFGALALRITKDKYYNTVENLEFNKKFSFREKLGLSNIMPRYLRLFLLLILTIIVVVYICFNIVYVLNDPSIIGTLPGLTTLRYGIPSAAIIYFVWLTIYPALIVDLLLLNIGIVFVQKKIINKKPIVNVYNVDGCGGLRPIGELCLTISGIFFVLLTMAMVGCIYTPLEIFWKPISVKGMLLLVAGLIIGFVLFLIPQIKVHNYMRNEKRWLMNEVLSQIKDVDSVISAGEVSQQNKLYETIRFIQLHIKLDQIKRMWVYPFNINIVKRLLGLSIIPIVTNILVSDTESHPIIESVSRYITALFNLLLESPSLTPTPTPVTAGFGAVITIAGLLAVTYLLRRKK